MLKRGTETAIYNLGASKHTRVSFSDTAACTSHLPTVGGLTRAPVWRLDGELTLAAADMAPRWVQWGW